MFISEHEIMYFLSHPLFRYNTVEILSYYYSAYIAPTSFLKAKYMNDRYLSVIKYSTTTCKNLCIDLCIAVLNGRYPFYR